MPSFFFTHTTFKGFSCQDCDAYYKSINLSPEKLNTLIQKCSKHRSTQVPPHNSPKEMWKLDITSPNEKKVEYVTLLTRAKRRELREAEEKEIKKKKCVTQLFEKSN